MKLRIDVTVSKDDFFAAKKYLKERDKNHTTKDVKNFLRECAYFGYLEEINFIQNFNKENEESNESS